MDKPEKLDISYMGPIFKKYRIEAKRTQEEVAERVGITDRFLMALENEEKRPSIDNLLRLVDALNIPGDAILHPQLQHIDSDLTRSLPLLQCTVSTFPHVHPVIRQGRYVMAHLLSGSAYPHVLYAIQYSIFKVHR